MQHGTYTVQHAAEIICHLMKHHDIVNVVHTDNCSKGHKCQAKNVFKSSRCNNLVPYQLLKSSHMQDFTIV